ncbi:hypothetical protein R6Q57_006135 [Mikania cordata]
MDPVQEWMASLQFVKGKHHPTDSKLVGKVDGVDVTMSFRTLEQIAKFDRRIDLAYEYSSTTILYNAMEKQSYWDAMQNVLYEGGDDRMSRKSRIGSLKK